MNEDKCEVCEGSGWIYVVKPGQDLFTGGTAQACECGKGAVFATPFVKDAIREAEIRGAEWALAEYAQHFPMGERKDNAQAIVQAHHGEGKL